MTDDWEHEANIRVDKYPETIYDKIKIRRVGSTYSGDTPRYARFKITGEIGGQCCISNDETRNGGSETEDHGRCSRLSSRRVNQVFAANSKCH